MNGRDINGENFFIHSLLVQKFHLIFEIDNVTLCVIIINLTWEHPVAKALLIGHSYFLQAMQFMIINFVRFDDKT